MSERIHKGPYSLRLWREGDGKVGLEWHCPPGQCGLHRHEVCPHVRLPEKSGGPLVCGSTERQRAAMQDWAIQEFVGFARTYRERT